MKASTPRPIRIHYRRPPDRDHVFRQTLVHERPTVLVTFMPAAEVDRPMQVAGRTILEPGAPVVWFTFPGAWHDIGRFHTGDGRFTGYYANILTPVERTGMPDPPPARAGGAPPRGAPDVGSSSSGIETWHTTDLCLDVFLDSRGGVHVLDRQELEIASTRGWIDSVTVRTAEAEAARLTAEARAGRWPPAVVDAWPLDRARAAASPDPPA